MLALAAILVALLAAAPAAAVSLDPYDGRNPFRCKLQDVGTGGGFRDPRADPLCVAFDKTNQDVAGLGFADFAANEPGRVAAAQDKCFYFQRDEWRGSALEDGELETYHWRGRYYFDRARGMGGIFVRQARVAGNGGDPAYLQWLPAQLRPFFHATGGGAFASLEVEAEPRCVRRVDTPREARRVYRRPQREAEARAGRR